MTPPLPRPRRNSGPNPRYADGAELPKRRRTTASASSTDAADPALAATSTATTATTASPSPTNATATFTATTTPSLSVPRAAASSPPMLPDLPANLQAVLLNAAVSSGTAATSNLPAPADVAPRKCATATFKPPTGVSSRRCNAMKPDASGKMRRFCDAGQCRSDYHCTSCYARRDDHAPSCPLYLAHEAALAVEEASKQAKRQDRSALKQAAAHDAAAAKKVPFFGACHKRAKHLVTVVTPKAHCPEHWLDLIDNECRTNEHVNGCVECCSLFLFIGSSVRACVHTRAVCFLFLPDTAPLLHVLLNGHF